MSKAVSVTIEKNISLYEEWVFIVEDDWEYDWDAVCEQVEQAKSASEKPFKSAVIDYNDEYEEMYELTLDEVLKDQNNVRELK